LGFTCVVKGYTSYSIIPLATKIVNTIPVISNILWKHILMNLWCWQLVGNISLPTMLIVDIRLSMHLCLLLWLFNRTYHFKIPQFVLACANPWAPSLFLENKWFHTSYKWLYGESPLYFSAWKSRIHHLQCFCRSCKKHNQKEGKWIITWYSESIWTHTEQKNCYIVNIIT
jgi:hypothetical protein